MDMRPRYEAYCPPNGDDDSWYVVDNEHFRFQYMGGEAEARAFAARLNRIEVRYGTP